MGEGKGQGMGREGDVIFIWISPVGNSGCFPGESQLRQSRATQPTMHAGSFSVSIIHQTDTDCRIFNVRTDLNGYTLRESALKVVFGTDKNPLPHRGIVNASAACRSDALPTELHPQPVSKQMILDLG